MHFLASEVENLVGDLDGHLEALEGRHWDAVLDNSGFEPRIVRNSARLLSDSVARYVFLSTESVYADRGIIDQDEALELPPPYRRSAGVDTALSRRFVNGRCARLSPGDPRSFGHLRWWAPATAPIASRIG